MAAKGEVARRVSIGEYETLNSEYTACQQHLKSKEEALKIMKGMIESTNQKCSQIEQESHQLRSQLARLNSSSSSSSYSSRPSIETTREEFCKERDQYILQLESAQETIASLKRELQLVEDERDEIASEKEVFSKQCENLRQLLEEEQTRKREDKVSLDTPSYAALESLVEDNRKLKLELVELQVEKDCAVGKISRYKRAVEKRKLRESREQLPPASPGNTKWPDHNQSVKRAEELEILANSLSESVKEKSIALTHQRKANKMLATRITELEHKLKVLEISGLWTTTSIASHQQGCLDLVTPLEPVTTQLHPQLAARQSDSDQQRQDREHHCSVTSEMALTLSADVT